MDEEEVNSNNELLEEIEQYIESNALPVLDLTGSEEYSDVNVLVHDEDHITLEYEKQAIRFIFDQISVTNTGAVKAQVKILNLDQTRMIKNPLRDKVMDINSERDVSMWAKNLGQVTSDRGMPELFWERLLNHATTTCRSLAKQGDPLQYIRDAVTPVGGLWSIPKIALSTLPTIWFGDGDSGKSLVALIAAVALHTGGPVGGMVPSVQKRCMWLDFEFDMWAHKERMMAILGTRNSSDLPDIGYLKCTNPLEFEVDRIRAAMREHGTEFVIIDSVGAACGGEPESAAAALSFSRGLSKLKCGSLLIAHTTKAGDNSKPFGSVFWYNLSRLIYFVQKGDQSQNGLLEVSFDSRKANVASKPLPTGFVIRITSNEEGEMMKLESKRVNRTDVHTDQESITTVILRELSHGERLTVSEIADRYGKNTVGGREEIKIKLQDMINKQQVKMVQEENQNRYCLLDPDERRRNSGDLAAFKDIELEF